MVLLSLICVAAATIYKELEVVNGDDTTVTWVTPTRCLVFAASILLIIELTMLFLHFLNPSHFNNKYTAYCRLVRIINQSPHNMYNM